MRHRLRSAGFVGALLALIGPELAITTATVVLTPSVAEAQVGGVHRRTRRRTRRRTAAVVHTADMNQAAAQQQQQQEQQQQSWRPEDWGIRSMPSVADARETPVSREQREDRDLSACGLARAPPGPCFATAVGAGMRDG